MTEQLKDKIQNRSGVSVPISTSTPTHTPVPTPPVTPGSSPRVEEEASVVSEPSADEKEGETLKDQFKAMVKDGPVAQQLAQEEAREQARRSVVGGPSSLLAPPSKKDNRKTLQRAKTQLYPDLMDLTK